MVAAMLATGAATVEAAKGGKGGGKGTTDGLAAICSYLNSVITYPYVTASVQDAALYLWDYYGCAAL
jgi:hypothetical protein